ncbi:MAG TPA: hypothetical protein O0X70_02040 [Methanocorpusculum sp.]|nr:hypothetical protein [Methanocorpusculum sp.]
MKKEDSILVDMNGLIYLAQLSLLEQFFKEYSEVFTSDFVRLQEMQSPSWDVCKKLGLQVLEMSPVEVGLSANLMQEHKKLSFIDAGLIVLSRGRDIPILTEDAAMQRELVRGKAAFVTLPDVVSRMEISGLISSAEAEQCFILLRDVLLKKRYDYAEYLEKYR